MLKIWSETFFIDLLTIYVQSIHIQHKGQHIHNIQLRYIIISSHKIFIHKFAELLTYSQRIRENIKLRWKIKKCILSPATMTTGSAIYMYYTNREPLAYVRTEGFSCDINFLTLYLITLSKRGMDCIFTISIWFWIGWVVMSVIGWVVALRVRLLEKYVSGSILGSDRLVKKVIDIELVLVYSTGITE